MQPVLVAAPFASVAGSAMQVGRPRSGRPDMTPARVAASASIMTRPGVPKARTTDGATGVSPSGAYTTAPGVSVS